MWKHLLAAGATLALILLARGMSAPASAAANPSLTCVNPRAAHKAYLVIQHLNGAVVQKCVGFDAGELNGDDLMKQSGVAYETQKLKLGTLVCSIDGEPAQFTECLPKSGPVWLLWVSTGGSAWVWADTAYNGVALKDGDALGWHYTGNPPSPPPLPRQ